MKARIKGTNTIVECVDTGTLINENKGIECRHSNGAIEVIPGDCLIELENDFDWQSFRNQAAKDFVSIMCNHRYDTKEERYPVICKEAIALADELIKQLKGKEEK